MPGKCKDEEHFNTIPSKFRFKARVYDFDPLYEEDENATEKIVGVEMIDYKTGHIWYNNGMRSTNFELIYADETHIPGCGVKLGDTVYWISRFGAGICQGNVVAIKISAFGFDLEISTQDSPLAIKRELEKVFLSEPEAQKHWRG